MSKKARPYIAYLLRLWRAPGPGPAAWRASLEDPHTGKRVGFGSLEHLVAFLQARTGTSGGEPDDTEGGPAER